MKYILFLAVWLLPALATTAQITPAVNADSLPGRTRHLEGRYLETNIDYPFVDSLSLWRYMLDTVHKGFDRDEVKALGALHFWRTTPVLTPRHDSTILVWTPAISFEIYRAADSYWCSEQVRRVGLMSSCWMPNTDGNIVKAGPYLLISRASCVDCQQYRSPDYCHPVIATAFRQAIARSFTTIKEMVAALPLRAAGPHDLKQIIQR